MGPRDVIEAIDGHAVSEIDGESAKRLVTLAGRLTASPSMSSSAPTATIGPVEIAARSGDRMATYDFSSIDPTRALRYESGYASNCCC